MMKTKVALLDEWSKLYASQNICDALRGMISGLSVKTIALFASLPDEPDLREFVAWCVEQQYTLLVPDPLQWQAFVLRENKHSIYPIQHPIDILLVPGVAFSRDWKRLGRGGGRYDRMIAQVRQNNPSCHIIGVCFAQQLVDDLPTEPHDQLVDEVVSREL